MIPAGPDGELTVRPAGSIYLRSVRLFLMDPKERFTREKIIKYIFSDYAYVWNCTGCGMG